jgi:protein SCO1/2
MALALVLTALAGCSSGSAPGGTTAGAGVAGAASGSGFDGALLPADLSVHPFTLTDQDGRRVSLRDERGRVTILAFLYTTSRTTAPLIAQQVRGALDELASEPGAGRLPPALAVSVAPAGDTSAHIRAFLRANGLAGRLEYLTGSPAQLRGVWRAYGVTPASAGAHAYESAAFVVLLDGRGAPRVEVPLEELTPEALAHDVRRLEGEDRGD